MSKEKHSPSSRPKSTKEGKDDAGVRADAANGLPPKPYTDYTIFYRIEREYLLQSSGNVDEETLASINPSQDDPLEHPRPEKYQFLLLPPYWYSSAHPRRRRHRKGEGRMDLATLSRTVSANWKKAGEDIKQYCMKLARADKERYRKALEEVLRRGASGEAAKSAVTAPLMKREEPLKLSQLVQADPLMKLEVQVVRPRLFEAPTAHLMGVEESLNFSQVGQAEKSKFSTAVHESAHGLQVGMLRRAAVNAGREALLKNFHHPAPVPSFEHAPLEKRRRFSAPQESSRPDVSLSGPGLFGGSNCLLGGDNCEPGARPAMRRLTTTTPIALTGRALQELAQIHQASKCLGGPFHPQDLGCIGSFSSIQIWKKEHADANGGSVQVGGGCVSLPNDEHASNTSPQHQHPAIYCGMAASMCGPCLEN